MSLFRIRGFEDGAAEKLFLRRGVPSGSRLPPWIKKLTAKRWVPSP